MGIKNSTVNVSWCIIVLNVYLLDVDPIWCALSFVFLSPKNGLCRQETVKEGNMKNLGGKDDDDMDQQSQRCGKRNQNVEIMEVEPEMENKYDEEVKVKEGTQTDMDMSHEGEEVKESEIRD
jgi:hypothetical protein